MLIGCDYVTAAAVAYHIVKGTRASRGVMAIHIGVGSNVVCSTSIGNARASVRGTDDQQCSHAFFVLVIHHLS